MAKIEHLDTVIRGGTAYMIYKQHKPTTLRASIIFGNIGNIGKFETTERKIDLNADRKRYWAPHK